LRFRWLVLGTDVGCYTKQGSEGWARDKVTGFLERFGFHRVSGFLYDQPTIPNSTPNSENPREYSNSILFTYEISAAFPTWIAAIIAEKLMLYTNPTMQPTYQKLSSKLHINF
jgi:hypothetical protein